MKKTILAVLLVALTPLFAFAADGAAGGNSMAAIGAGVAIGLAVFGAALGQGKAISSGLDSIGRNPGASGNIFTPMLLGLAFIESLVVIAFVIAFFLQGKA